MVEHVKLSVNDSIDFCSLSLDSRVSALRAFFENKMRKKALWVGLRCNSTLKNSVQSRLGDSLETTNYLAKIR